MKIQCDVCESAPATVICCADEAALCGGCDIEVHAANKLASKHQRLLLQSLSNKLPQCDICQEKTAFIFCVEDRALFCRHCDESIHLPGTLSGNHQRLLATGIRVALSSTCSNDGKNNHSEPPPPPPPIHQTQVKPFQQPPSSFTSPWGVDDFLHFSDIESSDKKGQVEVGEFEWIEDMGLYDDHFVPAAEVPQLQVAAHLNNSTTYRAMKSHIPNKKPRVELVDEEHFIVPDLG